MTTQFASGFPHTGLELDPVLGTDFTDYPVTVEGTGAPEALTYNPFCFINGNTGMFVNSALGERYLRTDFTGVEEIWMRAYVYVSGKPDTDSARIARFRAGGSQAIAGLYVDVDGKFWIAEGGSTTPLWKSNNAYNDQWARVEWRVSSPATGSGDQRVRIYSGANIFGEDTTTHFETSGNVAVTTYAAGIQTFLLGVIGSPGVTVRYTTDAVQVTNDGWPGSIAPPVLAAFEMSDVAGSAPLSIDFTNLSINAATYSWDFGDGTPTSGAVNPTHVYRSAGTFIVALVATNAGGGKQDQATQTVTVTPGAGTSTLVFEDDYETGDLDAAYANPLLALSGIAPATYVATDVASQTQALHIDAREGGRLGRFTFSAPTSTFWYRSYVTVTKPPLTGEMVLATAYQNDSPFARVSVNQHGKWSLWRADQGLYGNLSTESVPAISHNTLIRMEWQVRTVAGAPGEQVLKLYVGKNAHDSVADITLTGAFPASVTAIDQMAFGVEYSCSGRVTLDATALSIENWIGAEPGATLPGGKPHAGFIADKLTIAMGDGVNFTNRSTGSPTSYAWNFGDGTGTGVGPTHTYPTGGTYPVTLTATNSSGTSAPATLTVTALDPARGRAVPKVYVGTAPTGTFRAESTSAVGRLVNIRSGVAWREATPRVFKNGLWSSSSDSAGTTGTGWGAGTAGSTVWYGSAIGQSSNAQTAWDLALAEFGNIDIVRAFTGNWADTWAGITQQAKVGNPDVVCVSMLLKTLDWTVLHDGTQSDKDALYQRMVTFTKSIPSNIRVWFTCNHEPESKVVDVDNAAYGKWTQATWKDSQRMWQDAVIEARAARTTHKNWLKYAPTLMGWTWDPRSGRDPDAWTVNNVDAWGIDAYATATVVLARDYAQDHGMEWFIPEVADENANDLGMRDWLLDYWVKATQVGTIPPRGMIYWQANDAHGTADTSDDWNAIITSTDHPETVALWNSICTTGFPPKALWP